MRRADSNGKAMAKNKRSQMLTVSKLHDFFVTDYESGDDREEFETCYKDIYRDYDSSDISTAKSIFKILLEAWMYGYKTIYTKTHYRPLLLRILQLVSQQKVLNFLLPGFPAKSSNREDRVLGVNADFAEYLALRTFIDTARKIEEIYPNGTQITIMQDSNTLDDVGNEVCSEDYDIYYNDLNEMIMNIGADDIIKLVSIGATPKFQESNDLKSDFIRISIHHHHPRTEKFPIDLYKKHDCNKSVLRAPWRHAAMFDSMRGEYVIDHKSHLQRSSNRMSPVLMVNYKSRHWLLIKLCYAEGNEDIIPCENDIEVSMVKNGTGIILENKSGNENVSSSIFHPDCLTALIKEFGVVILKGFNKFNDEDQIVDFYSPHGSLGLVQWEFGPLRKGKPYKESTGFVNENIDSTIRWDLMAPPQYMGISQTMYTYEQSTCKEFMIYCQKNLSKKGVTTFVDAHAATLALNGEKKQKWKNTTLVYENQANHKNNHMRCYRNQIFEYPLIQTCPWTKKDVFRWAETNTEGQDLKGSQNLTFEIKTGSEAELSPSELEDEIKHVLLDDRFIFEYYYSETDQVFVNNYTILHGTKGFVRDSELWKLHLVPSSDNIPDYFQNI